MWTVILHSFPYWLLIFPVSVFISADHVLSLALARWPTLSVEDTVEPAAPCTFYCNCLFYFFLFRWACSCLLYWNPARHMGIPRCATPAMAGISRISPPTCVPPVGQAPLLSSRLWGCWAPGPLRHKVWPRAARPIVQRGLHHPELQCDSLFSAVLRPLNCQLGSQSSQQNRQHSAEGSLTPHAPALLLLLPLPSHDVLCWKGCRKGNRKGRWANLLAAQPPFSWWWAVWPRCLDASVQGTYGIVLHLKYVTSVLMRAE